MLPLHARPRSLSMYADVLVHHCLFSRLQMSMAADPNASIALPFTPRPENLTGELVGDVGFDPLNFSEEVRRSIALLL